MNVRCVSLVALIASVMVLTGCGGSGSSATEAPPVADPPAAPSVTITGLVTDMPIQGALVTATVDGERFDADAPTDATGAFSITLTSANGDALVLFEASESGAGIEFVALQGTLGEYLDGGAQNITNVTTAQYLLARDETADGSIDTIEELNGAAADVDPVEVLELAAAIKVIVDGIDGVTLPDDYENVLELAEAIVDGASDFVEDLNSSSPDALAEATAAILEDSELILAFEPEDVPGLMESDEGELLALFADGSGYRQDANDLSAVGWQVNEAGKLEVAVGDSTHVISLLAAAGNVRHLHISLADDASTSGYTHTAFLPLDDESAVGSYLESGESAVYRVVIEAGDGFSLNTQSGAEDDFFVWSIDARDGLAMTDDGVPNQDESADTSTTDYLLADLPESREFLRVVRDLETDEIQSLSRATTGYLATIVEGPDFAEINAALLADKTYVVAAPLDYRVMGLQADGVLSLIYQMLADDQFVSNEVSGQWSVDAVGALTLVADEQSSETLTLTSGLGEASMTALDGAEQTLELQQPQAFDAQSIVGFWFIWDNLDQTESQNVQIRDDGTGTRSWLGATAEFSWSVDEGGALVMIWSVGDVTYEERFLRIQALVEGQMEAVRYTRVDGDLIDSATDAHFYPRVLTPVVIQAMP
ncbi:MAG: carboxypeptidase-like regulatory domain-containing protein [Pseudomonadota bacterium]